MNFFIDICKHLDASPRNYAEWKGGDGGTSFKWLHTVWFHSHDISEMTKFKYGGHICGCWWQRGWGRCWNKGECSYKSLYLFPKFAVIDLAAYDTNLVSYKNRNLFAHTSGNQKSEITITGLGKAPGAGNGSALQCSCQEMPWEETGGPQSTGVAKSRTRLSKWAHTRAG